jgi:hypothetical protein
MKQMKRLFLLILCACFFSIQINAQSEKVSKGGADIRVATALNQIKTEYKVGKDGMYEVTYQTNGKRTQYAFIDSETATIFGSELRLVFSYAQVDGKLPTPSIANLLLEENLTDIPNVWTIAKTKNGIHIANMVYVPANSDGKTLHEALSSVMNAADKLEERLTKEDKL